MYYSQSNKSSLHARLSDTITNDGDRQHASSIGWVRSPPGDMALALAPRQPEGIAAQMAAWKPEGTRVFGEANWHAALLIQQLKMMAQQLKEPPKTPTDLVLTPGTRVMLKAMEKNWYMLPTATHWDLQPQGFAALHTVKSSNAGNAKGDTCMFTIPIIIQKIRQGNNYTIIVMAPAEINLIQTQRWLAQLYTTNLPPVSAPSSNSSSSSSSSSSTHSRGSVDYISSASSCPVCSSGGSGTCTSSPATTTTMASSSPLTEARAQSLQRLCALSDAHKAAAEEEEEGEEAAAEQTAAALSGNERFAMSINYIRVTGGSGVQGPKMDAQSTRWSSFKPKTVSNPTTTTTGGSILSSYLAYYVNREYAILIKGRDSPTTSPLVSVASHSTPLAAHTHSRLLDLYI
ncbi:hypothetical protein ACQRIT_005714 [Beauveria bassiana]